MTAPWRRTPCWAAAALANAAAVSIAAQTVTTPSASPPAEFGPEEAQHLDEALSATAGVPSIWMTSASLRASAGFRDNVLLSPVNPVSAPLLSGGGDFIVNRLPTDGTEVSFLATGDYTLFPNAPDVDPEVLALAQASLDREVSSRLQLGLEAQYVYIDQVFDVSVTEATLSTVRAAGHGATITPSGEVDLGRGWKCQMELDGTRQLFSEPLDDYWEAEPTIRVVKEHGSRVESSLGYQFGTRWYDSRAPLDAAGRPMPGNLQFVGHELELRSTVYWDAPRHWRTQLRLGWFDNSDNGGHYFDFTRLTAGAQAQFARGPWKIRAEARMRWYGYPVQRSDGAGSPLRERTDVNLQLRGEYRIGRKARLFVQYDLDASDDNAPAASYDANNVAAGVEYDL